MCKVITTLGHKMADKTPSECTRLRRQALTDHAAEKGIPLEEAMAMLDSNFASEPHSCGPESSISEDLKQRHTKAGLGVAAKMLVGLQWRDPDVSET
jgi:hypothetical protein